MESELLPEGELSGGTMERMTKRRAAPEAHPAWAHVLVLEVEHLAFWAFNESRFRLSHAG